MQILQEPITTKAVYDGKVLIPQKRTPLKPGDFWLILMPILNKSQKRNIVFNNQEKFDSNTKGGIFNLIGSVPAKIKITHNNIHKLRNFIGFTQGQRINHILQDL